MNKYLLITLVFVLTGCGTLITQTHESECPADTCFPTLRMYSGTYLDACAVVKDVPRGGQIGAMLFWDLPFSLAVDTVILPYTTFRQIRDGSHKCIPLPSESAANAPPNVQSGLR
ncbi:MAG: YceK/YidQ family lipoprotein [Sideroxydans sp.]|nr:YceK/YidQ family lipoprotein [Sideroxydans sp.]